MSDNAVSLQAVLQFALPIETTLIAGSLDSLITWSVTVRARPPAFPDIYGGELAFVSMEVLRSYDTRITLHEVVENLAQAGVSSVAIAIREEIPSVVISLANDRQMALLRLPEGANLPTLERAVNKLIVNQAAQLTQRAMDIQRQLTRLAAENRDLNSLLQVIAGATAKPIVVHDDAGVLMAQVYPNVARRGTGGRNLVASVPYSAFQNWLSREAPTQQGAIVASPIGHTTVLKVEKRVAGYLSLIDQTAELNEFERLVLTYGADVCAIELAKTRAIASAVEQARGDWIQMWLSGNPTDDDLLATRAQQSGFDPNHLYIVTVYRATAKNGATLPLESLTSLIRDDLTRRQINGAVGQNVDVIVVLYPLENPLQLKRMGDLVDETRLQLATRTPSGLVAAGISRPVQGLASLREAYREAKDAMGISGQLGEQDATTFYGDLKLYQFLLSLKEKNLEVLRRFYEESLYPLVEHDERKQGDLVRTLNGFFEANGNLAKAATDLDVHRNTLVYRLERISELTGLDLNDADNRLILHLALKVQRVLATLHGG
ncbi:MAG: helix-turn-helix domain-containing protein [Anaerolineae bacterium]|nr:helix-turn-helix domain-containing protein [Anaerolineae bacterium]